jgi:hypothetical protein
MNIYQKCTINSTKIIVAYICSQTKGMLSLVLHKLGFLAIHGKSEGDGQRASERDRGKEGGRAIGVFSSARRRVGTRWRLFSERG